MVPPKSSSALVGSSALIQEDSIAIPIPTNSLDALMRCSKDLVDYKKGTKPRQLNRSRLSHRGIAKAILQAEAFLSRRLVVPQRVTGCSAGALEDGRIAELNSHAWEAPMPPISAITRRLLVSGFPPYWSPSWCHRGATLGKTAFGIIWLNSCAFSKLTQGECSHA